LVAISGSVDHGSHIGSPAVRRECLLKAYCKSQATDWVAGSLVAETMCRAAIVSGHGVWRQGRLAISVRLE
jgi:hypothetical protein